MKVTLIGAGPGDPELITLKGIRALESADVVLHDALSSTELLEYCRPECVIVNVGKRFAQHSCNQDVINHLIVEYAQQYGHVVRLKGGDPFIFGRGYEEMEYAQRHGIEVQVVPGISSSYAVPALAGIPLTTRGLSESFWVVTGTTKDHKLSNDLALAAQSSATVVVLMGMHKLPEIVETYAQLGKIDLPVAIIQNGTRPEEKIVTGKVGNILQLVQAEGIGSPAIIVLGAVAQLADNVKKLTQLVNY
ncbi:uroporphyrinogen-III C-methyltransferase [Runella slithyformis]|uniref:uroporphyrinogen-III C-methyltransferase n=1 Tax=Runella slithyformis (strain ATCC 29530 / DSM 19594 / LMG 11500 / NCIMB 11436 / LSU 4) TaxID=761193 RepID=A0A7U3ZKP0_RUNSL|nr:uroporphyrinogen-III C-methyltransferase [Runella slithyformis]AEI48940.1 uroporphyrin-III C-methyltransferase [Runella slithyformis DSM 19594]